MSPKYTLNSTDLKSIFITLVIVAVSAVIAQLLVIVPALNLGKDSAIYTLIIIAVLKFIQKFIDGVKTDTTTTVTQLPKTVTTNTVTTETPAVV